MVTPNNPIQKVAKNISGSKTNLRTHWILVFPVFLLYHLGLLFSPKAGNGVDFFTRYLGLLVGMSWLAYLGVMLVFLLGYLLWLRHLRREHKFEARRFVWVFLESMVYALLMGPVAFFLLHKIHVLGLVQELGFVDRLVASAGAGFYEELIFRFLAIGLLSGLFFFKGKAQWKVRGLLVVLSSVLFSLAHYIGAGSDPWQLASFSFRLVLGVFLALIFLYRGFAQAVYTHFFYDVYVMWFLLD